MIPSLLRKQTEGNLCRQKDAGEIPPENKRSRRRGTVLRQSSLTPFSLCGKNCALVGIFAQPLAVLPPYGYGGPLVGTPTKRIFHLNATARYQEQILLMQQSRGLDEGKWPSLHGRAAKDVPGRAGLEANVHAGQEPRQGSAQRQIEVSPG